MRGYAINIKYQTGTPCKCRGIAALDLGIISPVDALASPANQGQAAALCEGREINILRPRESSRNPGQVEHQPSLLMIHQKTGTIQSRFPLITTIERARNYIDSIPGAVSGAGGHPTTFHVACVLVHGFALGEAESLGLMLQWNTTCEPPWSERELIHKLSDAGKASHATPRGHLLGGNAIPPPSRSGRIASVPSPQKRSESRLKARAVKSLPIILKDHACGIADFWELSPIRLMDDPKQDGALFLKTMFAPDDVVWIGGYYDSGSPLHARNFRPQAEWSNDLQRTNTNTQSRVCACTFKPGTFSRSLDSVDRLPFLVTESDNLNIDDQCALIKWMCQFMNLRAIIFSGGESLHAWFDRPSNAILTELRGIMLELELDMNASRDVQAIRMPGVFREDRGNWQTLRYLAPTKKEVCVN